MKKWILLSVLLWGTTVWGQNANDCTNAIVVCGNSAISSNASGFGTQELDNESNPCFFEEVNSLWMQLNIAESGTLEFTLSPESSSISVDYDFYIFGPNFTCGNFNDPLRCSTTNPGQAGLSNNLTGLRAGESEDSEGPGPDGNSFVAPLNVTAGETYYLLVDRPQGSGGFRLDWQGSSNFYEPPAILGEPDAITVCLAGLGTAVDIAQNESQIATDPSLTFEYYRSLADAFDGRRKISAPTRYPLDAATTTIYVKTTNTNGCFEISEQAIEVDTYVDARFRYNACDQDGNGTEAFQISQITEDIRAAIENPSNFTISLHTTEADAQNDVAAIGTATYDSGSVPIYTRIRSNADSNCYITLPVNLQVISSPIPSVAQLVQCDVDPGNAVDGMTAFNLDQAFHSISGVGAFQYFFYESTSLRDADIPISNTVGYRNTQAFNQTLFYKIITDTCVSFGTLELQVEPTSIGVFPPAPLLACDHDPNDGVLEGFFDLDTYKQQGYPGLEVAFYSSVEDASLEQNPLPGSFTSASTTVYFRVENGNQCQMVDQLELQVFPLPEVALDSEFFLCAENPSLTIGAPPGFDIYQWTRTGNEPEEISNTQNVVIDQIGSYRLEVGSYVVMGRTTLCTTTIDFVVSPSTLAIITEVLIRDASDNNSLAIQVDGAGDYEYSLDGANYQDSNLFENLAPGILTVYVRDKHGCGIVEEMVSVLGYPKFFSPNGDEINDFWQIIGIDPDLTESTTVNIYDRYGKLVVQLDPSSRGWDGTYNNTPLPASDYWFRVVVPGSREFKGHFALKR